MSSNSDGKPSKFVLTKMSFQLRTTDQRLMKCHNVIKISELSEKYFLAKLPSPIKTVTSPEERFHSSYCHFVLLHRVIENGPNLAIYERIKDKFSNYIVNYFLLSYPRNLVHFTAIKVVT